MLFVPANQLIMCCRDLQAILVEYPTAGNGCRLFLIHYCSFEAKLLCLTNVTTGLVGVLVVDYILPHCWFFLANIVIDTSSSFHWCSFSCWTFIYFPLAGLGQRLELLNGRKINFFFVYIECDTPELLVIVRR